MGTGSRGVGAALAAVLGWMALAGAGPTSAAPTPAASASPSSSPSPSSPQAIYDQGQAAYDRGDWAETARDFVHLLPAEPAKVQGRSPGTIAYRYADALVRLGRAPEAKPWIDAATASLASAEPGLAAEAWLVRADVDSAAFDYPAAFQDYLHADALLTPAGFSLPLIQARLGAGMTGSTIDPARVLPLLTALMNDPAYTKQLDRKVRGSVEDVAARAALNLGDLKTATRLSRQATQDSGGLTEKVTLSQIVIRSDAATIARLAGRDDDARESLLYTGAGHLDDMDWISERTGELPVCGEPVGDDGRLLDPNDVVVIAFAIGETGVVKAATPVYASRTGALSQAFVQAVSDWRWNPQAIAKVKPFWRAMLQLELRCQSRPILHDFTNVSYKAVLDELHNRGALTPVEYDFASRGGYLNVRKNDPRLKGPDGPILYVAASQASDDHQLEAQWAGLDLVHAPPAAYALAVERYANNACTVMCPDRGRAKRAAARLAMWAPRFMQRFPGDPAGERLLMAESLSLQNAGDFAAAQPLLAQLTPASDAAGARLTPLEALAYLHRAIGLERAGDASGAKAMLLRSGLNSDSCALFNTHPLAKSMNASWFEFPSDVLLWRFNGYVLTDFDIGADGHVTRARAVIAYPPFIFDQASLAGIKHFTYIAPHIGGEALGCEGESAPLRFKVN